MKRIFYVMFVMVIILLVIGCTKNSETETATDAKDGSGGVTPDSSSVVTTDNGVVTTDSSASGVSSTSVSSNCENDEIALEIGCLDSSIDCESFLSADELKSICGIDGDVISKREIAYCDISGKTRSSFSGFSFYRKTYLPIGTHYNMYTNFDEYVNYMKKDLSKYTTFNTNGVTVYKKSTKALIFYFSENKGKTAVWEFTVPITALDKCSDQKVDQLVNTIMSRG